jgi:hypothetical protein
MTRPSTWAYFFTCGTPNPPAFGVLRIETPEVHEFHVNAVAVPKGLSSCQPELSAKHVYI